MTAFRIALPLMWTRGPTADHFNAEPTASRPPPQPKLDTNHKDVICIEDLAMPPSKNNVVFHTEMLVFVYSKTMPTS